MKLKVSWRILLVLLAMTMVADAQTVTTMADFDGPNGSGPFYGSLLQGLDGNFYGTTAHGGAGECSFSFGCGSIFRISATGRFESLYSFCPQGNCTSGNTPLSGLLQATDGNAYGTAWYGGQHGPCQDECGAIYKVGPRGAVTTLYSFCAQAGCKDGAAPYGNLIEGYDGNYYGTSSAYGPQGGGTVFKITPAGELTTLYGFCQQVFGCLDGETPTAGLVQGTDGNFYGTTVGGGANGPGTVFKVTAAGVLTTLHSFAGAPSDGANPYGGLVRGSDGDFYGTTFLGGSGSCTSGCGTIFKITSAGSLTTLHTFQGADGSLPTGALMQATDGNFYGTTDGGGSDNAGTLFEISAAGTFASLYSFCGQPNCTDGASPYGALFQGTDGILYGTTYGGGVVGCQITCGTVFSLDMGLGPFVSFVRAVGRVGQTGGILGQGFTGTTGVSFDGIPAEFTVVSDTFIKATVPAGAATGFVTVATPGSTLTSNVPFHVIR
jgi:uncharacterized repeat protein (TIGR03803 family)